MPAVRRGADDYAQAFAALLPTGPAWPREPTSVLMRFLAGMAAAWEFVDGRAADLLGRESDPRSTYEMLDVWERAFGLPDPCVAEPLTIGDRRLALVKRITMVGGQSRAFFIGLASGLGYTITITEFAPFRAGVSRAGDTQGRWHIGSPEMRFVWKVRVTARRLTWFKAGVSQAGVDPHLRIGRATDLECVIRRWAPAHTQVVFDYSTSTADSALPINAPGYLADGTQPV